MKYRKILLTLIFITLFILPLNAQQKNQLKFGLYTGWSIGIAGYSGGISSGGVEGYLSGTHPLKYHIGGYIQYNLTRLFGMQLDMNYQKGVSEYEEEWTDIPYHSWKEPYSIISVSLCGVLSTKNLNNRQFYFLAGGGLSKWWGLSGDDIDINLMVGTGIKIFFLKSKPRRALNLGASFHHLFHEIGSEVIYEHIRLYVGFEF